jgi:hypothetical protein
MSAAQTFAVIFKERMMDMPDELNAKKDIDEYSKKITKEIKEEAKNNKAEKAEKKKDEKKKKKNNLDEDGNEKPKKPLTKYQQYIKDNQQRIRDEFPELSNTERFSKLAEEWKPRLRIWRLLMCPKMKRRSLRKRLRSPRRR